MRKKGDSKTKGQIGRQEEDRDERRRRVGGVDVGRDVAVVH